MAWMICPAITSRGWPCRSYMARRKKGNITTIMQRVAALELIALLSKKKSGTPMSAAAPKQMSCRLVKPNMTLDFTFVRSLGIVTYANRSSLLSHARKGYAVRGFVAPYIPSGGLLACEQLNPGNIPHELNNPFPCLVGLFAVFLHRGNDNLVDTPGIPFGAALCGNHAQFRICPRPVAHTPEQGRGFLILLDPDKGNAFVSETPGIQNTPCLVQHGEGDPEEQGAVLIRQFSHRQGLDILNAHGGIMTFRRAARALLAPYLVGPGRVRIDNIVFFHACLL